MHFNSKIMITKCYWQIYIFLKRMWCNGEKFACMSLPICTWFTAIIVITSITPNGTSPKKLITLLSTQAMSTIFWTTRAVLVVLTNCFMKQKKKTVWYCFRYDKRIYPDVNNNEKNVKIKIFFLILLSVDRVY